MGWKSEMVSMKCIAVVAALALAAAAADLAVDAMVAMDYQW
jgi:hypothetical protein